MRIDSLTSLRFFAAAAVFIHHMEFLQKSPSPDVVAVFGWFFEGFAGVQFFYVLSGFVIAYSFAARKGSLSYTDFMFFRAARLFPIHWLTLLITIVCFNLWNGYIPPLDKIAINAALLQSHIADPEYYYSFNAVSWSISTELFFYAAFCLIVPLSDRLLVAGWLLLLTIIAMNVANADMANYGTTSWLLYINPVFRFVDFLTGILLYRLFVASPLKLSGHRATALEACSLAAIVGFAALAMVLNVPIQWRWDLYYIPPMALIVFVFAHQQGAISKLLSNRTIVLLGDASFALYMIHQLLIRASFNLFDPVDVSHIRYMLIVVGLLLAVGIALSVVTHLCFEMPVNKALRRWWIGRNSVLKLSSTYR